VNQGALQQATGEQLWQATVSDPHQGYYETMAPTVWNGLVFVGDSGSEEGLRGFVRAYNAATGKLVWNFWTVPAPGQGWV
jgi:outer membrane protein assembly factor BamB